MPILKTLAAAAWPLNFLVSASVPALRSKTPEQIKKEGGAAVAFKGKGVASTLEDHVGVLTGSLPKLFVAHAVWLLLAWAADGGRRFATLEAAWILPIVLRDLVITFATASFCDFVSYSPASPWYDVMTAFKFTPERADGRPETLLGLMRTTQQMHDMFWSTLSTLISSALEVAVLHLWATGRLGLPAAPLAGSLEWYRDVPTVLWVLSMPYWRLAHFYSVHRMMHAWHTRSSSSWLVRQVPDVGHWLYKNVHELHHKSKNPTAWSGVSMHPVESSIYYSAAIVPLLFAAHPIVFLYTKFDLTMAALIGHDGFASPGGGSQPHWLHHQMVDVNFGENYAPFDYLFGTFAATEEEAVALRNARIAAKRKFGVALEAGEAHKAQ